VDDAVTNLAPDVSCSSAEDRTARPVTSTARRRQRAGTALACALLLLVTACTADSEPPPVQADLTWTEHAVPDHPGMPGRTVLRDLVLCGDRWWLVGAVFLDAPTETRDTRPAAWTSRDGIEWSPVPIRARTYWGRRAIINSIACSRGRVAMVGARSGGAHGNPRVTTFRTAGTQLVDVPAVFTQYGGVTATGVGPIAGGARGWLITGSRTSGPGVWVTDDPRGFTKVEGEPGLVGDGSTEAIAQSAAWDGSRWTVVGGGARKDAMADRDPFVWTSSDGLAWQQQPVPATAASEDLHRVIRLEDGRLLALGLSSDRFASWVRSGSTWERGATFGAVAGSWQGTPYVASLAEADDGVLATLSDADTYQLWWSEDGSSWGSVEPPVAPTTASDHALVVAAHDDTVLLLADDGEHARVYVGSSA